MHLFPAARGIAFAAALLAAAAAPALAQNASPAPAQGLQKVRIGTLKMAALTDVWVAKQAGIFAKNGLDAELVEFRSGNEAIAAQRGGHVDIVLSIPGTAMTANERGFDLVLIAQNETAHTAPPDAGALIVRKDSGLKSVADLAGKTFALSNTHSQLQVAVEEVLKKHGVNPASVTFMEIPFSSHPGALKSGQIDVSVAIDPWTTQLRTSDYAKVLAWDYVESLPGQPIGAWYARSDFIRGKRDVVDRFARSIRDAIQYMNADTERAKGNVAAYTGLNAAFLKDMPLNRWSYEIDPATWQGVADMMHASGELQKPHKVSEYLSDIVAPYVVK
jgi:NitT/TauT family transport system substrate-binding protein